MRRSRRQKSKDTPVKSEDLPQELKDLELARIELDKAIEDNNKFKKADFSGLRKEFKSHVDQAKRKAEKQDEELAVKRKAGTTRSGNRRGAPKQALYTDGKWVNKGIDHSQGKYDDDELEYLKKTMGKFKQVNEVKEEYLKYLVVDVFLSELKEIKEGKIQSEFHDRYKELSGKSKTDLLSEIRTSLFTNEQRDYINGLLQGAFDTTSRDDNDDIKHSDINYVETVMLAEVTTRIVKHVHKFDTNEQALAFMIKSSREACGFDGDDDI